MLGRLHVITDSRPGAQPLAVVSAALDGGADVIQVRAKGADDRDLYRLAAAIAERCAAHRAACIIDDRVDVALAVGATGVHVGERDLPVEVVRQLAGPELVIGATVRDAQAARLAAAAGASYVGAGPCYPTTTKTGLPATIGPMGIAEIASATQLPVIAIGGIEASRVPELVAAGAHGIAVVSAISQAADPKAAVVSLVQLLGEAQ